MLLRSGGRVTPPPFQIETFCSCCCCRGGSLPRTGYFQVRSVWISIMLAFVGPTSMGVGCSHAVFCSQDMQAKELSPVTEDRCASYVYTSSHLPWGHGAILVLGCNVSLNRTGETIERIHHYLGKEPSTYCNIGKSLENKK